MFLPNSAVVPFVIAVAVACLFVSVRLVWAASGDVARFSVAGDLITDASIADVPVIEGPGYDGQFFYRLARDPLDFSPSAGGVRIDSTIRFQRIAYPTLAYVFGGFGDRTGVPWSLVLVNVLALGALGALGGTIAQSSGRHAAWGLLLPAYFGFVATLSRDLSEIVEVTFLIGGLIALRRHRPLLAVALLGAAVLSRETALFAIAGIAIWRLFVIVKRRSKPQLIDLAWVVPPLLFGTWQLYVADVTGSLPATDASANRFVFPGSALIRSIGSWFPEQSLGWGLHTLEVVTLLGVCVLAFVALRSTAAPPHERAAFVCLFVAAISVDIVEGICVTLHDFRAFADLYALAILVVLGSRTRLAVPAAAVGLCTIGAIARSVRVI